MPTIQFINVNARKTFYVVFDTSPHHTAYFEIIVSLTLNASQNIHDLKINREELANQLTGAIGWVASQPLLFSEKLTTPKQIVFGFAKLPQVIHALSSLINDVSQGNVVFEEKYRPIYNQLCEFLNLEKFKKNLTPVAKLPSSYIKLDRLLEKKTNVNIAKSTHQVTMVEKLCKPYKHASKKNSVGFIKNTADRQGKIAEIEAANAAHYRFFLGHDRAPKVKAVFDQQKLRRGIYSEAIEGFISFDDCLKKKYIQEKLKLIQNHKNITNQLNDFIQYIYHLDYSSLVEHGILEMLVCSYAYEENDLHGGNWGFDSRGHVVRIDFDQSLWPLTCKYANISNAVRFKLYDLPRPREAFLIHEHDIREFPSLTYAKPCNWIFSAGLLKQAQQLFGANYNLLAKVINDLKKNPHFEERKWAAFLKLIILPAELNKNIYSNFIGNPKSVKKYTEHLQTRIKQFKNILLLMPEFQAFLKNKSHDSMVKIIKDIKEDNEHAMKDKLKPPRLQLNIDEVVTNYKLLLYELDMRQAQNVNLAWRR